MAFAIGFVSPGVLGEIDVSAKTTSFTQTTPSATWTIVHNLGRFPSVTVVDSAGSEIHGAVLYVDSNNVTISFSAATAGSAYLN